MDSFQLYPIVLLSKISVKNTMKRYAICYLLCDFKFFSTVSELLIRAKKANPFERQKYPRIAKIDVFSYTDFLKIYSIIGTIKSMFFISTFTNLQTSLSALLLNQLLKFPACHYPFQNESRNSIHQHALFSKLYPPEPYIHAHSM